MIITAALTTAAQPKSLPTLRRTDFLFNSSPAAPWFNLALASI
jgi:hypothetical protein